MLAGLTAAQPWASPVFMMSAVVMDTDSQLAPDVWYPPPSKASVCMYQPQRFFFFSFPGNTCFKTQVWISLCLFMYYLFTYLLGGGWI